GVSGVTRKEYDIFFKQSVDGVGKGTGVTFSGVPVGQVTDVALWTPDPSFVRVRIAVDEDVPVLKGTVASIQSSFTGGGSLQLQGAAKGAPPITEIGPDGVPEIPARAAGLGAIFSNAPELLDRLTTLTERLTSLVSDKNQASIAGILHNMNDISRNLANQGPSIRETLKQTRETIKQAGDAANQIGALAQNTNGLVGDTRGLVNDQGKAALTNLQHTLASAQKSLDALDATLDAARPGMKSFSQNTVPETNQLLLDLHGLTQSLEALSQRVNHQGAGALVQPPLPDYKPKGKS
ncbi:MAG: MCE family protein, partial [Alphaproteobacteria bacterium]|nr:MCE family protein [Alphaproteobacteria bacterium]